MTFGTVINCMDGRVQYPVLDFLKKHFDIEYFDAVNEAGPLKTLILKTENHVLRSLKEKIDISLNVHGSRFIAVVGHHDCAGNPVSRAEQEEQIRLSLQILQQTYGKHIFFLGLFVDEHWQVEELMRIEAG